MQLVEQRLYLCTPASVYQTGLHFSPPLPQLPRKENFIQPQSAYIAKWFLDTSSLAIPGNWGVGFIPIDRGRDG